MSAGSCREELRTTLTFFYPMFKSQNKIYENSGNEHVLALIKENGLIVLDIGFGAGSLAKKLLKRAKQ